MFPSGPFARNASPVPFAHLHVHSHYSLLDGTCQVGDLVEAAKEAGTSALALTDHGNLFGAIEFYRTAKEAGVRPILGIEAYVSATWHSAARSQWKRLDGYTRETFAYLYYRAFGH